MNEDVDELYRRASALDSARPSEELRRRVLAHAAAVAAERTTQPRPADGMPPRVTANPARWHRAIVGTLAVAGLAGLVIMPQFFKAPPATPSAAHPAAAAPSAAPPAAPPAAAATLEVPPSAVANEQPALARLESRNEAKGSSRSADAARPRAPESARAATGFDPAGSLRRAAEIGDVGELQSLLRLPVDIDARDPGGRTALMLAALRGQTKSVDLLLSHGADPNTADLHGVTPLQAALRGHHSEAVSALRRAGAQ